MLVNITYIHVQTLFWLLSFYSFLKSKNTKQKKTPTEESIIGRFVINPVSGHSRPVRRFEGKFLISVLFFFNAVRGKNVFWAHGIFYCSTSNGHWEISALHWQSGIQFLCIHS